jgi:hypothetical protein
MLVMTQFSIKFKILQFDNDTENKSKKNDIILTSQGILHQSNWFGTPQQYGGS